MGLPGRVVLFVFLAAAAPAGAAPLRISYNLQSTDPTEDQLAALTSYIRDNKGSYFLLQGFACDTGGFRVSLKIASQRQDKIQALIQKEIGRDHTALANPAVIEGEPRIEHRKLEIEAFKTPEALTAAVRLANENTARFHSAFQVETPPETHNEPEDGHPLLWLGLLLAALVVVFIYFILTGNERKRRRHALTPEQAEAVQAITGEAPVQPSQKTRKHRIVTAESVIEPAAFVKELKPMASKKKASKPGPTIKKALDKAYENRSLGEIAKSPVHSLQGLTPRHSKMLEEAFGVKTVEDLAGLKYFELARAITVLARYED